MFGTVIVEFDTSPTSFYETWHQYNSTRRNLRTILSHYLCSVMSTQQIGNFFFPQATLATMKARRNNEEIQILGNYVIFYRR